MYFVACFQTRSCVFFPSSHFYSLKHDCNFNGPIPDVVLTESTGAAVIPAAIQCQLGFLATEINMNKSIETKKIQHPKINIDLLQDESEGQQI